VCSAFCQATPACHHHADVMMMMMMMMMMTVTTLALMAADIDSLLVAANYSIIIFSHF